MIYNYYNSVTTKGSITIKKLVIRLVAVIICVLTCMPYGFTALAQDEVLKEDTISNLAHTPNDVQINFDMLTSLGKEESLVDEGAFRVSVTDADASSVTLSWSCERIVFGYTICRFNAIQQKWEPYFTTTETSHRFTNLLPGTTYQYGFINSNTGELLGFKDFTTGMNDPDIKIKKTHSDAVDLEISNAHKGSKVHIYRKEKGGDMYEKIAEVDYTKTAYTDKTVDDAKTYYYKARAAVYHRNASGRKKLCYSGFSNVERTTTLEKMGLPDVSGEIKTFAYYTAVTAKSTPQYRLLNSKECYTDKKTGVRMVDGCYCVAMGSYYGSTIGTKYRITFDTGKEINVILCDQKADIHTNSTHQYAAAKDVLEFYCEKAMIPHIIHTYGNYNNIDIFHGAITKIEKYVDENYVKPEKLELDVKPETTTKKSETKAKKKSEKAKKDSKSKKDKKEKVETTTKARKKKKSETTTKKKKVETTTKADEKEKTETTTKAETTTKNDSIQTD